MKNLNTFKKQEEFQTVFQLRDSAADKNMVIYRAPGSGRIGIICSKKVGNSVVRHRFQRTVREAYRLHRSDLKDDVDIVIIARESAKGQGFFEIEHSFLNLAKKLSILKY